MGFGNSKSTQTEPAAATASGLTGRSRFPCPGRRPSRSCAATAAMPGTSGNSTCLLDGLSGEVLLRFGAVDYWCQVFVNEYPGWRARRRLHALRVRHPPLPAARDQHPDRAGVRPGPGGDPHSPLERCAPGGQPAAALRSRRSSAREAGMVHERRWDLAGREPGGRPAHLDRVAAGDARYR